MLWVYAISDRIASARADGVGLAGVPLGTVEAGAVAAIVSRHEERPAGPAVDLLWAHEDVVERLMDDRTVLPLRFGTVVADDEALREFLRDRHDHFRAALERVRGRVELGVRALDRRSADGDADDQASGARPSSGRAYLLAKLDAQRRTEQAAASVHEPLAALAVDARRRPPDAPGEVLRGAYLVDRGAIGSWRAQTARIQAARPELAIVCTGPWPPYSFVDARHAPAPAIGTGTPA